MAPNVSLADQIEKITAILTGMYVASRPRGMSATGRLDAGQLAARCGVTVAELAAWQAGLAAPSTGQALAWLSAIFEAERAAAGNLAVTLRQGHAGSDLYFGGHESTTEGAQAATDRLAAAFPAWRIRLPDGAELLGGDKPVRLTWRAVRTGDPEWPDVLGATSWELAHKLGQVEASMAAEAEQQKRYADGRGVHGRLTTRT